MTQSNPTPAGTLDPELRNSLILEDTDENFAELAQQVEELDVCYFNNVSYPSGHYVCSGSSELLRCEKGIWIREGSCNPDNP